VSPFASTRRRRRGGAEAPIPARITHVLGHTVWDVSPSDGVQTARSYGRHLPVPFNTNGIRPVYINSGTNPITLEKIALQVNGGTPVPVRFFGSRTFVLQPNTGIVADRTELPLVAGNSVIERIRVAVASAGQTWQTAAFLTTARGEWEDAADIIDSAAAGTGSLRFGTFGRAYCAYAILGEVTADQYAAQFWGDSNSSAIYGSVDDGPWYAEVLGATLPTVGTSLSGEVLRSVQTSNIATSPRIKQWYGLQAMVGPAYAINALLNNDVYNDYTEAEIKANFDAFAAALKARGSNFIGTTIPPRTVSNADNTPLFPRYATGALADILDDWVRAGRPDQVSFHDIAAKLRAASTGAGRRQFAVLSDTVDGTHFSTSGSLKAAGGLTKAYLDGLGTRPVATHRIVVSPATVAIGPTAGSVALSVTHYDANGVVLAGRPAAFHSSDPLAVSVDMLDGTVSRVGLLAKSATIRVCAFGRVVDVPATVEAASALFRLEPTAHTITLTRASSAWQRSAGDAGTWTQVANNVVRDAHYAQERNGVRGILIGEPAATNLVASPFAPATQVVTVVNGQTYTVSCDGPAATANVVLSGAGSGTATPGSATAITFVASGTSLTLTPGGGCTAMQCESGSRPTSMCSGTRAAETSVQSAIAFNPQEAAYFCDYGDAGVVQTANVFFAFGGTSGARLYDQQVAADNQQMAAAFDTSGDFLSAYSGVVLGSTNRWKRYEAHVIQFADGDLIHDFGIGTTPGTLTRNNAPAGYSIPAAWASNVVVFPAPIILYKLVVFGGTPSRADCRVA